MTIYNSSCFGLVLEAVMLFVVVQQTHSFTWTQQPEDPTIVAEGVSSSPVRLKWSWNLLHNESIVTITVTRRRPKEFADTQIASIIGDNPLQVRSGFTNDYRVEGRGTLVINNVTKADEDTIYTLHVNYGDTSGLFTEVESRAVIKVLGLTVQVPSKECQSD